MERFVNLKYQKKLLKKQEEIEAELSTINIQHCHTCGDTKPKHGFYPLWGMAVGKGIYQRSGLICNRCARTDANYEETFGEPKEIIEPS